VTDLRQRVAKTALRWLDCISVLKEAAQSSPKHLTLFAEKNRDLLLADHSASLVEADKVDEPHQFADVDRAQEKLLLTEEWRKMLKYSEDASSLRGLASPNFPGSASSYTGEDINETVPKFSSTRALGLGLANFHSPGRDCPEPAAQEGLKHLRLRLHILEEENQTLKSAVRQQLSTSPTVSPVLRPSPRKSLLRSSEPQPVSPQSDALGLLLVQAATIEHLLRESQASASKSRTEDLGSCS